MNGRCSLLGLWIDVRMATAGIAIFVLLVLAMMFARQRRVSAVPASAHVIPSSPAAPVAEDGCRDAVVLTLQGHSASGRPAEMSVQDLDAHNMGTQDALENEGAFSTPCSKLETEDTTNDGAPQLLKLCKPGVFVVHITGSEKGLFDFQAKPFPAVARPVGPLLLCNYAVEDGRVYDWVLRYQGGSKPVVFLLGSKGDPQVRP